MQSLIPAGTIFQATLRRIIKTAGTGRKGHTMSNYIQVCDVEKYYGNGSNAAKAVDRVSFQVEQGEFVGVMGSSGSGKT